MLKSNAPADWQECRIDRSDESKTLQNRPFPCFDCSINLNHGRSTCSGPSFDRDASLSPAGDRVLIGTDGGELQAINLADGSVAWTHLLEGSIKGLGQLGDVIYVGTFQGRIYALRMPEALSPPIQLDDESQ